MATQEKTTQKSKTTTSKTTKTTPKTTVKKEVAVKQEKPVADLKKLSQTYNRDYYENGKATGKSNYHDYSWIRLGKYFQRTAKHIVEKFSPSYTLDVGCAKGFLVKALSDLGVKALGIDPSEYAIANAPDGLKDQLMIGVAQTVPYPDNLVDLVTCFDVLEHIPEKDTPQVISEMFRVSNKWVIIRVVTKELPDDVDLSHETIRNKDWWIEKIKEAGGKIEPTENYVNNAVWWFNVPEFLIVARKA